MELKLGTPIAIVEQLLVACQGFVRQECQQAKQDLQFIEDLFNSVEECTEKLEVDIILWKKQVLSLINSAQAHVVRLVESTLQLSNVDLIASYVFRGEKSTQMPATISVQNDILGQAVLEGQFLGTQVCLYRVPTTLIFTNSWKDLHWYTPNNSKI